MLTLKCKMCGGDLVVTPDSTICECEYCGSKQTIPTADNEKKLTLFARANRLRFNSEFDKASGVYESIVAEFPEEAEAYWGLVLCKYGIEYVDDPATAKKVPTCHRSSFDSVLDNQNFDMACEYAEPEAKRLYREEAKAIETIRKGIIEVSGKEEPYDIFICYKETAGDGNRTLDSVLAQDIYTALTEKGYRVFFSRITLEDKLGQEYEPYIFAALHSARIMLAVGTRFEYYDAVWVKNEWSRYLKLIEAGEKKTLIPCFKNLDPYDMPKEFAKLQAQDLGKVGAMQDLLRGIEKILGRKKEQPAAQTAQTVIVQQNGTTTAGAQAERGFMALEDGEWGKADRFFEEALNLDPKCAEAHLGKLLLKYHKESWEALISAWKAKYAEATTERLHACETDSEHIREKVQEYAVEGYLAAVEISRLYDYSCEYDSALSCRKSQKKRQNEELKSEHHLTRAQQYAQGETAKLLADGLGELNAELDGRIAKAEAEDTTSITRVKAAYAEFITGADAKAAQMNAAAKEKQEKQYQAAVATMNAAENISGYKKAIDMLKAMNGYKDSDNLIAQCQREIERLLEEAQQEREREATIRAKEAKRKAKRRVIIIGAVVATIVVCIAVIIVMIVMATAIVAREDYKEAIRLMEVGNYDEAIVAFEAMDGYKDSEEQIENCQTALKNIDYDAAVALMDAGKYIEAIEAFEALDGYKDSVEQIENSKDLGYNEAVALMDAGEYTDAITAFEVLDGYKDSSEQIENILDNPDYLLQNDIGDILYFGNYQGEMIAWRVLDKTDEAILLISEYALDTQPYNTKYGNVSWENCTLRTWLNNDFYNIAFDSVEQAMIQTTSVVNDDNPEHGTDGGNDTQDKVFLLSIGETETYFADDEDRICAPTAYAVNQGANTTNSTREGTCWWWLRSSGFRSDDAARVSAGGLLDTSGTDASYSVGCVRPALWLNIGM